MTHDELLAKINVKIKCDSSEVFKLYKALRAVVELHKPANDGNKDICRECANLIDPWDENGYPCPTIQQIQEQLK